MSYKVSADITYKDYYNRFIEHSKSKLAKVNEELEKIQDVIDNTYQYLYPRRGEIRHTLGLTLDNYIVEFVNKEYNPLKALQNKVNYIYNKKRNDSNRHLVVSLLNYCQALERKNKVLDDKRIAEIKVNMTYTKYQEYVFDYYCKVHEVLLMGEGYKFTNGIGVISINRFKITKRPIRIDIKTTNENRKRILKNGGELYDDAIGEWCKEHNIEYNASKYKVNQIVSHVYRIYINETDRTWKTKISFWCTNYINAKYRCSTYQEIVDKYCNTLEDIFRLQVSIDIKVKLLLIKFPGYYVNFIRDVDKQ